MLFRLQEELWRQTKDSCTGSQPLKSHCKKLRQARSDSNSRIPKVQESTCWQQGGSSKTSPSGRTLCPVCDGAASIHAAQRQHTPWPGIKGLENLKRMNMWQESSAALSCCCPMKLPENHKTAPSVNSSLLLRQMWFLTFLLIITFCLYDVTKQNNSFFHTNQH